MPSEKDLIIDDNEDFENDLNDIPKTRNIYDKQSDFQIKIKPDHLPEKIDEDEKIIIDWETTSVIKRTTYPKLEIFMISNRTFR
ncbi:uncharacterized protein LOC101740397 [Bombyx mori]|uniref:Uncharacterized protein n=1 Tax=Bombyx mori TaxID=7091 RepID=A0A8R2M7W9_BOMMO|nr:uncharacterized protein LOC101740397 isoform X3 [Bombyx mori]